MTNTFQETHELRISFVGTDQEKNETKQILLAWLPSHGVESFVEGVLDSLDLDPDYEGTGRDHFAELGGTVSPISVFDYELSALQRVQEGLENEFSGRVETHFSTQQTSAWQEGWKESFKPIRTERFLVYPPWEEPEIEQGVHPLIIDPGMAFGTGQHQTTQLCLRQIERVAATEDPTKLRFMDVGTGSGVLAIAAKKLGFPVVDASDIEAAAVHATTDNARKNGVEINVFKGSVPIPGDDPDGSFEPYQVVVANILIVVLERIIYDLAEITASGGRLILSGIIREQEERMLEMADDVGFGRVASHYDGDWVCLDLEKL